MLENSLIVRIFLNFENRFHFFSFSKNQKKSALSELSALFLIFEVDNISVLFSVFQSSRCSYGNLVVIRSQWVECKTLEIIVCYFLFQI